MIRTILSPGVELKEIDKSQYTPDVATTPRALVIGFTDKGPVNLTTDITSMADFRTIYGTPTNEPERYFYNAAEQLVGSGATVVAAKIPYVGEDNYVGLKYSVSSIPNSVEQNTYLFFKDGTSKSFNVANNTLTSSNISAALSEANKSLTDIESIIIGCNITSLGDQLFSYQSSNPTIWCTNLKRIQLPSKLISIGNQTFKECSALTNITIPSGVTSIGDGAFYNCKGITNITIPSGVTSIGNSVFNKCENLRNITIPSGVISIGIWAFANCSSLNNIILPSMLTDISTYSFENCYELTNITIPSGVTSIGAGAFENCSKLKNIVIDSNNLSSIGTNAFLNVSNAKIKWKIQSSSDISAINNYYWGLENTDIYTYSDAIRVISGEISESLNIPLDDLNFKSRDVTDASNILDSFIDKASSDSIESRDIILSNSDGSSEYALVLNSIKDVDNTIKTMSSISSTKVEKITGIDFLSLESGNRNIASVLENDAFLIVDKTRGIYKPFTGNGSNVDCLGILPVVTTAVNAMAMADSLNEVSMSATDANGIAVVNAFEPLSNIKYIKDLDEGIASNEEISSYWSVGPRTIANGNTFNSISKIASQFFPSVNYSSQVGASASENGTVPFDHNLFSYIGIVVFKIGVDRGNGCLVAEPVEAFAGSLLEDAKDLRTNASTFIENIVNTTSNYISIYVNENLAQNKNNLMAQNTVLYAKPSTGVILGFQPDAVQKKISYEQITKNMNNIFKAQSNILASTLDVVVDAGLSTIAQCVNNRNDDRAILVDDLPLIKGDDGVDAPWSGWRTIVNLMKNFCEQTRKDCVFIVDSPRFLSLRNQRKIVNPFDPNTSVVDNILPKIKYISGVGSSYGWGYTTWFKIADSSNGTSFWCPPSIFGASKYIITRTRWNTWDAPAGMTRGVVSVDDTSFEPDLNARNVIYSNGWNYALTDIQNGVTTLEGQKTFQSYTSAFDRINVRSLFLDVERRVFKIARNYIYEPNTADTRQQFVDNVTPILSSIKAQGGCYDYKIICDETNNTSQTIDNNELHITIGIQPTKTIEFILCSFVASRTGSDWSELVGL